MFQDQKGRNPSKIAIETTKPPFSRWLSLYHFLSDDLVLVTGLEPVRYFYRGILSPLCLPISPHQQNGTEFIIA